MNFDRMVSGFLCVSCWVVTVLANRAVGSQEKQRRCRRQKLMIAEERKSEKRERERAGPRVLKRKAVGTGH